MTTHLFMIYNQNALWLLALMHKTKTYVYKSVKGHHGKQIANCCLFGKMKSKIFSIAIMHKLLVPYFEH